MSKSDVVFAIIFALAAGFFVGANVVAAAVGHDSTVCIEYAADTGDCVSDVTVQELIDNARKEG